MVRIAITGISGLAGGHVGRHLIARGHEVLGISRHRPATDAATPMRQVADAQKADAWATALAGCDIVFHFADRADRRSYTDDNVGDAARVMTAIRDAAAELGLARIVAASSIYAELPDLPANRYGRSKRGMEAVALASSPGLPAIVLRLPPLYGTSAGGMMALVNRAVARGWPLPFGVATAGRRFLSLDALASLCTHLVEVDAAVFARMTGQVWGPADPQVVSLKALAKSLGRARLIPVPGIDRLIGGRIAPAQIIAEQERIAQASGWRIGR